MQIERESQQRKHEQRIGELNTQLKKTHTKKKKKREKRFKLKRKRKKEDLRYIQAQFSRKIGNAMMKKQQLGKSEN